MIYNEDAYYTGYARNVRTFGGGSKGAYAALVFDTIAGLIRDNGIGEIANSTLLDMLGGTKPTLLAAIDLIISVGYLEKKCGDGRGNKSIYYITEKGKENCPFMSEKGSKNFTKRVKNFNGKGKEILPINKELNKELNKNLSSFEVQSPSKDEREEDKEIFIEEDNNIDQAEVERQALQDVQDLFGETEKIVSQSEKERFAEFWRLFNPDVAQKCKYKVALHYWAFEMPEEYKEACITILQKGVKPQERNPFFFLQHFTPVRFFLDEREQYQAWKDGMRLCRVRWKEKQKVLAAIWAELFKMEILDEHYEKRFEI